MTATTGDKSGHEKESIRQPLDTVVLKYLKSEVLKTPSERSWWTRNCKKDATSSMSLVALGADAALSD